MRRAKEMDSMDAVSHDLNDSLNFSSFDVAAALLIDADEELIRTASIATLEADRSQQEMERWRLEVNVQNQRLVDLRCAKKLLMKEVAQLERSLDKIRAVALQPHMRTSQNDPNTGTCAVSACVPKDDETVVMPGTFALNPKGSVTAKEVELHYLMSRTIGSLDVAQADVIESRRQHADLCYRKKELAEDIKRLKTTYQRQERQKEELLQSKLFLKAAEADPSFRKALHERKKEEEIIRRATECRTSLKQLRAERASMVAHLLEGAVQREKRTCHIHKMLGSGNSFAPHPLMPSLQEENTNLHARYLQLVRSSEEEDAALAVYLNVLEERLLLAQKANVLPH